MNLARPMIMATAAAMLLGSMLGISFPLMGQKNKTSGYDASLIQNQFAPNQVAQNPSSTTKTTTTQTTPTQSTTTQTKTTTTTGQTKRPVQALW